MTTLRGHWTNDKEKQSEIATRERERERERWDLRRERKMRLSMANKARVCVMLRTMKTSYERVERRFNSYLLTYDLHVRSTRAVAYDDINSSHIAIYNNYYNDDDCNYNWLHYGHNYDQYWNYTCIPCSMDNVLTYRQQNENFLVSVSVHMAKIIALARSHSCHPKM